MSAVALLAELQAQGFVVRADAGQLRVKPRDAVTPALRAKLLAAKPALLAVLSAAQAPLRQGLAVREVLAFPARLLPDLPLATVLVIESPTLDRAVRVAAHEHAQGDIPLPGWLAMVACAEHGIASAGMLERIRTRQDIGGRLGPARSRIRSVHAVLEAFDSTLRAVMIEGGEP